MDNLSFLTELSTPARLIHLPLLRNHYLQPCLVCHTEVDIEKNRIHSLLNIMAEQAKKSSCRSNHSSATYSTYPSQEKGPVNPLTYKEANSACLVILVLCILSIIAKEAALSTIHLQDIHSCYPRPCWECHPCPFLSQSPTHSPLAPITAQLPPFLVVTAKPVSGDSQ